MDELSIAAMREAGRPDKPRLLFVDLEVSPILAWTYEAYQGNIIRVVQDPKIVSVAWQWEGEKTIHCKTLADYGYTFNNYFIDDREIVEELHKQMQASHIIIGHNIDGFDFKTAQARFLYFDLPPITGKQTIDTLKIARRQFRMPKNNLDEIYRYLFAKEGKTRVKHSDVIFPCIVNNETAAWKHMAAYNKRDIFITREVYLRIRQFHKTHPNLHVLTRNIGTCPRCSSQNIRYEGRPKVIGGWKQVFHCNNCKGYWRGELNRTDYIPTKLV